MGNTHADPDLWGFCGGTDGVLSAASPASGVINRGTLRATQPSRSVPAWLAPLVAEPHLPAEYERPILERSRSAGSVQIIQSVFANAIRFCGRRPLPRRIILKKVSRTAQDPMALACPPWSTQHHDSPPSGPMLEACKRRDAADNPQQLPALQKSAPKSR